MANNANDIIYTFFKGAVLGLAAINLMLLADNVWYFVGNKMRLTTGDFICLFGLFYLFCCGVYTTLREDWPKVAAFGFTLCFGTLAYYLNPYLPRLPFGYKERYYCPACGVAALIFAYMTDADYGRSLIPCNFV